MLASADLTSQHENLREFKWRLTALNIEVLIARQSLKVAQVACKRIIAELATLPEHADWLYHFQLVSLSLQPSTSPAVVREVVALATQRGDEAVLFALMVMAARIAVRPRSNKSSTRPSVSPLG